MWFPSKTELSLKRPTTFFKLEFKTYVDVIGCSKYRLSSKIAVGETTVFIEKGSPSTTDQICESSIYISSTGYENARVTCILASRLGGSKIPFLIIIKVRRDKTERVSRICVLETEMALCTEAVLRKWDKFMLQVIL